jgi:glycosyltransferase involved in cell wall biosynthesis
VLCLKKDEFWEARIKDLGVPVVRMDRVKSKLGRLFHILSQLRQDPPTIFQSQHFFTNSYAGVAARLLGIAGIGALQSNGLMEIKDCGRFGSWLSLRTPHMVTANSDAALRYVVRQGMPPARLFLLPNVVDTATFHPTPHDPAGPVRLLSVGRLVQSKRFDRFISLLARLRLEFNGEVNGTIVGYGPLADSLRAQAAAQGLHPPAFELRISPPDMASVYQSADIFVMTSEFEGTPNVLLEAMASGLPVVSTNVGGVPEIVRHGDNGFLADCDDDAGICAAVARLIRDPQLRLSLGQHGRAYVQANHSLERLPLVLSGLYESALSKPPVRAVKPVVKSHPG